MGTQTVIVLVLTALASAIGFARELTLAAVYGTSASADALVLALLYLEGVSVVMAQGIATHVLVPLFVRLKTGDVRGQEETLWTLLAWIVCLGTPFAFLGVIQPEWLTTWLAPGFSLDQRTAFLPLAMVLVPACMLLAAAGAVSGVLRARSDFYTPTIGRALFSLIAAAVLLLFGARWDAYAGALALAIAAVAQFAVHWWQLRLKGPFVRPQLLRSGVDGMLRATFPILLSVVLTNLVLPGGQRALASDLPVGTFATTNYALRLLSLVSLLTLSVYTVAATDFAQRFQEQGLAALRVRVVGHVQALGFVLAPATIVLMALSRVLVELAFHRGRYPDSAVGETAMALWLFAFALLPAGVAGIFHILFSSINQQFRFLLVNIPFVVTALVLTAALESSLGAAVLPVAYVGGVVVNLAASILASGSLCGVEAWTALGRYFAGLVLRLIVSALVGTLAVLPMTGPHGALAWIRGDAGAVEAVLATAAFLAAFLALSRMAGDRGLDKLIGAVRATLHLWRRGDRAQVP